MSDVTSLDNIVDLVVINVHKISVLFTPNLFYFLTFLFLTNGVKMTVICINSVQKSTCR